MGSRDYGSWANTQIIQKTVYKIWKKYGDKFGIISGHSGDVDRVAEDEALLLGMGVVPVPADWDQYGKSAGPIRNTIIVERCAKGIVFWNGSKDSRGTMDVWRKLRKAGKLLAVYDRGEKIYPKRS